MGEKVEGDNCIVVIVALARSWMRASSRSFFLARLAADLVGCVEGGKGTVEDPLEFETSPINPSVDAKF